MRSIRDRKGWLSHSLAFVATILVAGLQFFISPAWAGYELPPGERITNLPHIPRSMPNKESYETYDPTIGRNFDLKNFWMRADLRVRPEWRTNTCFGSGINANGSCNNFNSTNPGKANDFYVQQWVRLGFGYDLSPDVNFYFELIDSATWGGNGSAVNAGNGGDPLNHDCGSDAAGNCRLGVRAAYVLVRNMFDIQGLSMKAGRQYVIFGNHSLFGHFDWANTGYSHDGIMFQYSTKTFESYLGWFRNAETDLSQGAPVGSGTPDVAGTGNQDASRDADMFIFYNQIKNIPGFVIEPYYVYYVNNNGSAPGVGGVPPVTTNFAFGQGTPKASNQVRHMVGGRIEMRKGNWDFITENAYQFGQMGGNAVVAGAGGCNGQEKCMHINAWASRSWLGYTIYEHKWKPRLAANLDYASGDGRNYCSRTGGAQCSTANTFENFFPTNHIHMGYADVIAWKNMFTPQANFQARPSERDHVEVWYSNMNVASKQDCWYRAAQGCYVQPRAGSSASKSSHIGDEIDFSWTRMFADGNVAFQATYSHFFPGQYTSENLGTNASQSWGFVQLWMNF